jgi:hypothetical protein
VKDQFFFDKQLKNWEPINEIKNVLETNKIRLGKRRRGNIRPKANIFSCAHERDGGISSIR